VVEAEVELPAHTPSRQVALPPAGRWLVRAAVLAVAVAAPLVAFAGERKVSLDVEGEVRTVRTYAPDAQQLLERRGIETGKPDLVKPGKDGLRDGSVVKFRRAKRIELVLDGERKTVVARGLTVGEALKDLGLVPGPSDAMHPSGETKLRPGLSVFVRNAIHAKLRVDGQLRDVVSSADTVSNMLAHAGVTVGANDYVIPSRDTEPADGMWIRVVRVRRVVEERNVRVPYRYVTRHDADMDSGTRRVVQEGAEGLKVERSSVLYEDGVRVSSQRLDDSVVRPARDHVVHVGTREPQYSGGGSGGGKTQTGIASWFEADGLVAAHRSLPLGSVVKVTNLKNGRSVTVRINQRGPFVEGRVIDLSDDAFERLAPLGDGTIKVKVET
jgi:uncharacterized protein YabE (DUF348 family)